MNRALLLLVSAAILWSLGGLLIKSVQWHPMAIAGARSAIAAATVWLLMPKPRLTFSREQLGGAVAYMLTVALFVVANKLTTAANAIFLQYTAPIYIALFGAWFLGERAGWTDWGLILLTQIGIGLFFLDRLDAHGLWGNLCALASGLSFAMLAILLRRQKHASPFESVLLGNVLTALIGLPFMSAPLPDAQGCVSLALLGVFQLGLSYVLFVHAIKEVRALDSLLISTLEPVLNPLWVLLVLDERPQPWALAGGSIVIAAATLRGVLTARTVQAR